MNTEEYESREYAAWRRKITELEGAPLAERRAAKAEWTDALRNPKLIRERATWLMAGNYGVGPLIDVRANLARRRANHIAFVAQALAAAEWMCPPREARAAFNALSPAEKTAANDAVLTAINAYEYATANDQ